MDNNKFFLTKEGLRKIKDEYAELQRVKAFKVKGESPRIFHSEDINPEFLAFQEDLELLDTRLVDLETILKNFQLITVPPKEKRGIVGLGATVVVNVNGQEDEFEIVGSLEANPSGGRISNESPVGRALIGHRVGDQVIVHSTVAITYKIKKISY
ncbi:MAG: GreA/GreB family elongation factor [bacterium]|nr:GreA/GreB family elongation factor [bacterium]